LSQYGQCPYKRILHFIFLLFIFLPFVFISLLIPYQLPFLNRILILSFDFFLFLVVILFAYFIFCMCLSSLLVDLLFVQIDLFLHRPILSVNYFYSSRLISCWVIPHYLGHIYLCLLLLHLIASLVLSFLILLFRLGYHDFLFFILLVYELTLFFLFLGLCNREPILRFFLLESCFHYLCAMRLR